MIQEQTAVEKFMLGVGQNVPTIPTVPNGKTRRLRVGLIIEEALELAQASGVEVALSPCMSGEQQHATMSDRADWPTHLDDPNSTEPQREQHRQCLIGAGDAFADLLYVVYGGAVAYGLDMEPLFDEVQRSNLSKLENGHADPVSGKWIKGPNYSPANLAPLVDAQINGTAATVAPGHRRHHHHHHADGSLLKQLENLINANNVEKDSDTPDFILASYLEGCLRIFAETTRAREAWYGRAKQAIGAPEATPPAPEAPAAPGESA